jgi:hypothetical protein
VAAVEHNRGLQRLLFSKHTVALSPTNKNLKRTINVLFANVQAKGIALTALN